MSDSPVIAASVEGTPAPVAAPVAVPAKNLNSIQLIEQELVGFFKQREQSIANVHAVEGAIQAAQHLLGKLRIAVSVAEVEAKKVLVETENEVVEFVKKES